MFKKSILWSTSQAKSGQCSDIVRQSNNNLAEIFLGFNSNEIISYFAFTKGTQQAFKSDPGNANKHVIFPATYSFKKENVDVTYNNGNYSLTKTFRIDITANTLTEIDVQCSGNNQSCEKGISLTKIYLENQKKNNSFKPSFACVDDLPNRDMFSDSPIDKLKEPNSDAYYEAFVCGGSFSQEKSGREFAELLIKLLKEGNQPEYNAAINRSKQFFTSIVYAGQTIDAGCSKLELTKKSKPDGSKYLIDKDDRLDYIIYRTSGAAGFSFTGVIERRL